ncbi:MAG: hypothetical protein KF748_01145 [Xanthobacteraceae bacterium]|nr:hypothetical protein [Xanthobacteraceae bacterium]MBX3547738.1 hypothetical protein [Xanthobacteraceae bacterium]
MAPRHDQTGRTKAGFDTSREAKLNRPPPAAESGGFVWITREMMESAAWRALRPAARRVLDRICIEHMAHGAKENGRLKVPYAHFERYGLRRASISDAIHELEALGFIEVKRGELSQADHREPSQYALGWLPQGQAPALDRWRKFQFPGEAIKARNIAIAAAREKPDAKTYIAGRENEPRPIQKPDAKTSLSKEKPDAKTGQLSISRIGDAA